jgi:hypothetical protein
LCYFLSVIRWFHFRSLTFSYIQPHYELPCHALTDVTSIHFPSFWVFKYTDLYLFSGETLDVRITYFVLLMTAELQINLCKSDIPSVYYL